MSLHSRALLYTSNQTTDSPKSLLDDISHTLVTPTLSVSTREDVRKSCEELATVFHIPPLTRIQLLLWAAKSQSTTLPGATYLQACRVRAEFARFWMEMVKEGLYNRRAEATAEVKWLEYDVKMLREKLNEMTPEVLVKEFVQRKSEGLDVKERVEGVGKWATPNPEFSERMFEHPIFSLQYAIFQDRQLERRECEDVGA
ncbi:hypothetical protein DOTSEDRAFT_56435 [Dothistroma septosporum NZE10]|uniref:Uncharacterized protein n=1 Tax=Dothistroma septosporum (strain NZE10 / CBS 128990) TaxID=675120 RepID=N1PDL0_DOTSN|nr:hypothetical protein DOTSEDRAFT_56435 [Dothistroma septosporum NZE10]